MKVSLEMAKNAELVLRDLLMGIGMKVNTREISSMERELISIREVTLMKEIFRMGKSMDLEYQNTQITQSMKVSIRRDRKMAAEFYFLLMHIVTW